MKNPFALFLLIIFSNFFLISCKEDEALTQNQDPSWGNNPRTEVPDELVGYWQAGSFPMSSFNNYDGSYAGQAYEIALGYNFQKNGNTEEYFYYTNTSYYCRDQILGYRKGTVEFNTDQKSIKFYGVSGNYKRFDSCGSSQSEGYGVKKDYGPEDLYPEHKTEYSKYEIVQENGKTLLRIPYDDGSVLEFEKRDAPQ